MYRPRPGRHLYRHVGGVVGFTESAGIGTLDPRDEDRLPAVAIEDLGGAWVEGPDGQRFEVDDIHVTTPIVIESTTVPPFGEWEEIEEIELPDPDEAWGSL